ncbi:MAG: glycosyltransferase [Desulfuromonadales bacterium]|nr:glycosyltransferase [Desulfuromonadales bacterium]
MKLRIAVLGTRGIPDVMGGVETHCKALYPLLAGMGHHVTLFARKKYVAVQEPYDYCGVTVIPLWAPSQKNLEAVIHSLHAILRIAIRRKEFDLLHIHAVGPSLLVPLAKILGLKVVITHHGPDYDRMKWGKFAKGMLRLGEMLGCRYSDLVITVSRHICQTIQKLYDCTGRYIPNGVPLPDSIPAGDFLERHCLVPQRYILTVGRLVPEKGFHDLLKAFNGVKTEWKLVIAGAADHEDEYSKQLLFLAQNDNRVVMTGFVKGRELGELFTNAGLFVLPSYHEGLPIALLEAMSYGIPVLTSNIPANAEVVEQEHTFKVGDVEELTTSLNAFFIEQWSGARGLAKVAHEYNWEDVAQETISAYNDVMSPAYSESDKKKQLRPSLAILGTRGIPACHGGFETFAEQLSLNLVSNGWAVAVYCQNNGGEKLYESDWNGVRLVHIPVRGSDTIGSIFFDWKSTLHALSERPLILTLGYNTALFCLLYRLAGVTNLINMDGLEWKRKKWSLLQRSWLYLNERFACLVAHHLIADHPVIKTHLYTRANPSKITMIPYGVDIVSEVDVNLLKIFGLEPDKYVLIIARTEPENSILEIVKAFSKRIRGYKLVLVGGFAPDRYPYHAKIAATAGDETLFLGSVYKKDVVMALRTFCRLYIHGHQVGGTNPSLLEAMAAGSPILAHDNPFNRWVSADTAHYFKDADECCIELDALLSNTGLLKALGHAARGRCKVEFSNDTIMSKYQNLLRAWWDSRS